MNKTHKNAGVSIKGWNGLRKCHAGRAGAHPYHATTSLSHYPLAVVPPSNHLSVQWPSYSTPSFWRSWSIFASCHNGSFAGHSELNVDRVILAQVWSLP